MLQRIEIWSHHHTSYANKGDRLIVEPEGQDYYGQHGGRARRPFPRSSADRLERLLDEPPALEPDPALPAPPDRNHCIPLLLLRVWMSDGTTRQFRTESGEYLMLPWDEVDLDREVHIEHYNPELSLAVAALMPDDFLNRNYLLAGYPNSQVASLTDREKIARALQGREGYSRPPQGPLAEAIGNCNVDAVQTLLASGLRPSPEMLTFARDLALEFQIERQALHEIQSARSPDQFEAWDRVFRLTDDVLRDWTPPPSAAERSAAIVEELTRHLGIS